MTDAITFATPYDDSNIFAKILRGEIPSISVFENDDCLAFMDIMPQREGHTLVIPKRPASRMNGDLSEIRIQVPTMGLAPKPGQIPCSKLKPHSPPTLLHPAW